MGTTVFRRPLPCFENTLHPLSPIHTTPSLKSHRIIKGRQSVYQPRGYLKNVLCFSGSLLPNCLFLSYHSALHFNDRKTHYALQNLHRPCSPPCRSRLPHCRLCQLGQTYETFRRQTYRCRYQILWRQTHRRWS